MPGPASHRCLFLLLEGPGAGGIGGRVENPIHAGGSLAGNDFQEASSILSQHVTSFSRSAIEDKGGLGGWRPFAAIHINGEAIRSSFLNSSMPEK